MMFALAQQASLYSGKGQRKYLTPNERARFLDAGFIAVTTLKRRSRTPIVREIPVPPEPIQELVAVHGVKGRQLDRRLWKLSRSRAWVLVKQIMRIAHVAHGIHATPKGLRHGFGPHAIRSVVPLNLAQKWLGHARMETTAIYLQATGLEDWEMAERTWIGSRRCPPAATENAENCPLSRNCRPHQCKEFQHKQN